MEIVSHPHFLQIERSDTIHCSFCESTLKREIKVHYVQVSPDCKSCRFLGLNCTCRYANVEYLHFTCESCLYKKCLECDNKIHVDNDHCDICDKCRICKTCKCSIPEESYKTTKLCNGCNFTNEWKISTPQEKLYKHGIAKLKILAKNKKLKGYSKLDKTNLINMLIPLVISSDFPIKPA